jgi:hypothetical protein
VSGNGELEDSVRNLSRGIIRAVEEARDNPTSTVKYTNNAGAIAGAAAAAFVYAAAALSASDNEITYAKAVFLKVIESSSEQFKIIFAEDILIPGQVCSTFEELDAWFKTLEKTTMPARARDLLAEYGNDVGEETHEHWKVLAAK